MKTYDDIVACAATYAQARAELNDGVFAAKEAVLRARVGLAECLVEAGWQPDDDALALLRLDQQLLDQRVGKGEQEQQDEEAARQRVEEPRQPS